MGSQIATCVVPGCRIIGIEWRDKRFANAGWWLSLRVCVCACVSPEPVIKLYTDAVCACASLRARALLPPSVSLAVCTSVTKLIELCAPCACVCKLY